VKKEENKLAAANIQDGKTLNIVKIASLYEK